MDNREKTSEYLKNFWQKQFAELSQNELSAARSENTDILEKKESRLESNNIEWLKLIKGLFLFLPGAFLLFMTSTFLFEAFFSMNWSFFELLPGVSWLFLYSFMVLFGLGDLKNPKHIILPFSIAGISFVVYLSSFLFGDSLRLSFLAYYSMYLFPLVLIIPVFLRNLIKEKPELD